MTDSYYKLPDDTEEVISMALNINNHQIVMGEINPVRLCRRLVAEIRILQGQLKVAKGDAVRATLRKAGVEIDGRRGGF